MKRRPPLRTAARVAEAPRLAGPLLLLAAGLGLALCLRDAAALEVHVMDDAGAPLANAVVYVDAPGESRVASPESPVRVDQLGKRFTPMVTAIQTGSAILFPNSDNIRHHVYSFSPAKPFELKLYHGVPSDPVTFGQTGVVTLGCNIHDSMIAYVRVLDTPHFAVTDDAGLAALDLSGLDATVRVWHPFQKGDDLSAAAGVAASVTLKVPIDAALKAQVEAAIR